MNCLLYYALGALLIPCQGRLGNGAPDSRYAFISAAQQFCYNNLVRNSNCCLDEQRVPDVARTAIPPGAFVSSSRWRCDGRCWDDKKGDRGEALVWTPPGSNCASPRVLFLHGGSWEYCSPSTCGYSVLASKIASLSGAVVLVIDYPLVPVGNYSSILAHSEQALRWLASHGPRGEECSQDTEPILFLGGDSSGGGTAASLALLAAARRRSARRWATDKEGHPSLSADGEEVLPPVSGTFLYSPWLNLQCNTTTYYLNAFNERHTKSGTVYTGDIVFTDPPGKTANDYLENAKEYVNGTSLLVDPVASPYFAGKDQFDSSMYFHITTSGTEALTGDSVRFATTASDAGATVYLNLYPGMWHDFPMYAEGCGGGQPLQQAKRALDSTAEFLRSRATQVSAEWTGTVSLSQKLHGPAAPITSVIYGNSLGGVDMRRIPIEDLSSAEVRGSSTPCYLDFLRHLRIREVLFLLVGLLAGVACRQWCLCCSGSSSKQLPRQLVQRSVPREPVRDELMVSTSCVPDEAADAAEQRQNPNGFVIGGQVHYD